MDFLDSVGALNGTHGRRPRTGASAPGPRRTRRGLRISRPRPALHRRGPVSSVARVRDSGGACVPFSRLGRHQSERCGHPTDDVRGPVPAPGRHDGSEAASASRALGQPYTAAAPSPRWRGHPRSRRRPRPFPASLGRHQSSPATTYALSAAPQPPRAGALTPRARRSSVAGRARFGPLRRRRRKTRPVPSASGPIQRLPRMPRSMTAARRREAASRKHNKLAAPLPPPPPRRFGQELAETSDLSIRQSYSELRPWRAARGELRGQSAPSAVSGSVGRLTH